MTKDYPWGKGTLRYVKDATANDSDKSFTVPSGKIWVPKSVAIEFVATATAGTRSMFVVFNNGTDNYLQASFGITATANQTVIAQLTVSGAGTSTLSRKFSDLTASNNSNGAIMPEVYLLAGYVIRVLDSAAVDAAADDMTVYMTYVEYDA